MQLHFIQLWGVVYPHSRQGVKPFDKKKAPASVWDTGRGISYFMGRTSFELV